MLRLSGCTQLYTAVVHTRAFMDYNKSKLNMLKNMKYPYGRWALAVLLLVIAIFALLSVYLKQHTIRPTGTIFITSSGDPSQSFLQTYALSLADGSTAVVGSDNTSVGTMYAFSDDGSKVAFVGVASDRVNQAQAKKASIGQIMQIYRAQTSQQDMGVPLVGSSEQVTTSDDTGKMMPAISDDGQVLYVTTSDTGSDPSFSSYQLHLVSSTSPSQDIPRGIGSQPHWLTNDTYYFIGTDGIRIGSVSTASSTLILPVAAATNFKLSISQDHHMLAFSNPDARKVYFFAISHGGLILSLIKELDVIGYWIVFSPDGRLVAIQTTQDDSSVGVSAHPSLSFFDTSSFNHLADVPLDPLLNDRLFVTDWR